MARYKGRQNAKAVERDFPHFVDIVVPLGGLGTKLTPCTNFTPNTASNRSAVMVGTMPTAVLFGGALLIWPQLNHSRPYLAQASSCFLLHPSRPQRVGPCPDVRFTRKSGHVQLGMSALCQKRT